jgi:hypothetical protein
MSCFEGGANGGVASTNHNDVIERFHGASVSPLGRIMRALVDTTDAINLGQIQDVQVYQEGFETIR